MADSKWARPLPAIRYPLSAIPSGSSTTCGTKDNPPMSKQTRARARTAAAPPPDTRPFHERSPILFLAIATAIALLPFVNKAFTMDDPLFVWSAQWIADHPLDPNGFTLNWYGRTRRMGFLAAEAAATPPLTSYALALASAIVGWEEAPLHVAFGLFAFAVVAGTWSLARGM